MGAIIRVNLSAFFNSFRHGCPDRLVIVNKNYASIEISFGKLAVDIVEKHNIPIGNGLFSTFVALTVVIVAVYEPYVKIIYVRVLLL